MDTDETRIRKGSRAAGEILLQKVSVAVGPEFLSDGSIRVSSVSIRG